MQVNPMNAADDCVMGDQEMKTARRVAAVIVHYGDPQRTTRAVMNHCKLGVFTDIIVIANDLLMRPEDLIDSTCTWLIPSRNLGFGGACQLGATTCRADVYAFFNAHVTIDRKAVERCVEAFDFKDVGIVSPISYYPGTGIPSIDWRYARCARIYSRVLHRPISVPLKDVHPNREASLNDLFDSDWAAGAAIFCRDEVIRDIRWDGSYFLGVEDVDICMRAKKSGWRVVTIPSAIAFHTGESTRNPAITAYYAPRNQLWFIRKYHDRRVQALVTAYLLLLLCRVAIADVLKKRRPSHAKSAILGILDGWLLLPHNSEALPGEPLRAGTD
jgi:N-acetylglucosaminyl-diphospho-decaprenol L-rhamnosyltransferase